MTNWYLTLAGCKDKQLLYSLERPTYSFPVVENKRAGKTVLIPNKKAVWKPIVIELPTRLMPETERWISQRNKINITATQVDLGGRVLEEWQICGAEIVNVITKRGRTIDIPVKFMVLRLEWARKVK